MNYLPERHRSAFDLLFSRLPHEYAPRSANENFCCWSTTPYLDIIALIRRYQSQETDMDDLESAPLWKHSLMSASHSEEAAEVSPALTSRWPPAEATL